MRWQDISDDREKYNAYLCSREWSVLREKVRERCRGKCERCRVMPMDAVHHLTYERKYHELLEDLQAICSPCHEFTHGKSQSDPRQNSRVIRYLQGCKNLKKKSVPGEFLFDLADWQTCDKGDELIAMESVFRLSGLSFAFGSEESHKFELLADVMEDAFNVGFAFRLWLSKGMPVVAGNVPDFANDILPKLKVELAEVSWEEPE